MRRGRAAYLCYFLSNVPKVLGYRLFRLPPSTTSFRGFPLSIATTSAALTQAIENDAPFAAIRFGAVELSCLNNHEKIELGFKKTYKEPVRYSIKNNAGYFPTDDVSLKRYGDELLALLPETDYLGISGAHMENYFARFYCPSASYLLYEGMEPLHGTWTKALKGKKVLVITAFKEDVAKQYPRRKELFPNAPDILPEMELKVLQAPVTFAENTPTSPSFFDELARIEAEMDQIDYDVLLVGAGAYGSFLALHAKSKGKKGIQTGGATNTLFGILGKRWEHREHVAKHVNEAWIRPADKPKGFERVEGGTYW